jgi:hypothetical protein
MQSDDVNIKGILGFLGLLVLTLVGIYIGVAAMLRDLEKNARHTDERILRQASSAVSSRPYFPAPREQPNPRADLDALRASEEAELNSYGWMDKPAGVVRIPIDRAIELLAQPPKAHP